MALKHTGEKIYTSHAEHMSKMHEKLGIGKYSKSKALKTKKKFTPDEDTYRHDDNSIQLS